MASFRCGKLRSDNKTGIIGVHKFVYQKRKSGVKKRFTRPDKYTVQLRCRHICIETDLIKAAERRLEEEIKENMYSDVTQSTAYQYLQKHNLSKEKMKC